MTLREIRYYRKQTKRVQVQTEETRKEKKEIEGSLLRRTSFLQSLFFFGYSQSINTISRFINLLLELWCTGCLFFLGGGRSVVYGGVRRLTNKYPACKLSIYLAGSSKSFLWPVGGGGAGGGDLSSAVQPSQQKSQPADVESNLAEVLLCV